MLSIPKATFLLLLHEFVLIFNNIFFKLNGDLMISKFNDGKRKKFHCFLKLFVWHFGRVTRNATVFMKRQRGFRTFLCSFFFFLQLSLNTLAFLVFASRNNATSLICHHYVLYRKSSISTFALKLSIFFRKRNH